MRPAPAGRPAGPATDVVSVHHKAVTAAVPDRIAAGTGRGTALWRGRRWRVRSPARAGVVVTVPVMTPRIAGSLDRCRAVAGGQPHSPTSADLLKTRRRAG